MELWDGKYVPFLMFLFLIGCIDGYLFDSCFLHFSVVIFS